MKQPLFIFLFFLVVSCNRNDSEVCKTPISVKAEIIKTLDTTGLYVGDTSKLHITNVKLWVTNISDKPIAYWIMTCDWAENWIANREEFGILRHSCDANCPIHKQLKPKESLSYNALVCRSEFGRQRIDINNIKFGFIYIDTVMCKTMSEFRDVIEDKSKWNLYWSNSVNIDNK